MSWRRTGPVFFLVGQRYDYGRVGSLEGKGSRLPLVADS